MATVSAFPADVKFRESLLSALLNQRKFSVVGVHAEHRHIPFVDAAVDLGLILERPFAAPVVVSSSMRVPFLRPKAA